MHDPGMCDLCLESNKFGILLLPLSPSPGPVILLCALCDIDRWTPDRGMCDIDRWTPDRGICNIDRWTPDRGMSGLRC